MSQRGVDNLFSFCKQFVQSQMQGGYGGEGKQKTCAPSKRVPGTLSRAPLDMRLPLLSILYVDRRPTPMSTASRRACLESLQSHSKHFSS